MNWLWAYYRRKVAEAIRAGVYDALAGENGAPGLSNDQAERALAELMGGGAETTAAPPPQLGGPGTSGLPALTEPPKRGPGRPRKFRDPGEPE